MPEVSVILPFYNSEKTLERSVESVLNQTFTDFELILVNNNSSDNSLTIASRLAEKDNRVKLLNETKQGVVFASQKGFNCSETKIIARADADDVWHKDKLLLQHKFLRDNPKIDLVSCCVKYIGKNANIGMQKYVHETNKNMSHEQISVNRFSELQVINPTIMFRKEAALKYGLYKEGNFPEDYDMFLRWIQAGVKYHKLPDVLLNWYDHDNRLTRTDKRYSFDAFYKLKAKYLVQFLKENNPFFPDTVIWGAGKTTKKRVQYIEELGVNIKFFIDVDIKKINDMDVFSYEKIPEEGTVYIVSFVNNQGVRAQIRDYLISKNYIERKDFIIA